MRDQARLRSYAHPCVITILLYFALVVPGFFANRIYRVPALVVTSTNAQDGRPLLEFAVGMLLWLLLFVPGLAANYLYLKEGRRMEEIAGEPLPGVNDLRLLWSIGAGCASLVALFAFRLWLAGTTSPPPY